MGLQALPESSDFPLPCSQPTRLQCAGAPENQGQEKPQSIRSLAARSQGTACPGRQPGSQEGRAGGFCEWGARR